MVALDMTELMPNHKALLCRCQQIYSTCIHYHLRMLVTISGYVNIISPSGIYLWHIAYIYRSCNIIYQVEQIWSSILIDTDTTTCLLNISNFFYCIFYDPINSFVESLYFFKTQKSGFVRFVLIVFKF